MSVRFFFLVILVTALIPVAYVGWSGIYKDFLEASAPVIEVIEPPRGVGLTPVRARLRLTDKHAGLDEVVVRTYQKGESRTILKQKLDGRKEAEVRIDFPGNKSDLEEGIAKLEIRAFDRSFWNNMGEKIIPLNVDFRKPSIEVLSSQHNSRLGGSQLVIYKVTEENYAISGVKVGGKTFVGYPARGLDKELSDNSLFAAFYAIDFDTNPEDLSIKVFAEDQVGNAISQSFFNRVQSRAQRKVNINLKESFLRGRVSEIASANFNHLQGHLQKKGQQLEWGTPKGSEARLLEEFQLVNDQLRPLSSAELTSYVKTSRYERYFLDPFVRQAGTIVGIFGDKVHYTYKGLVVGKTVRSGYEIAAGAKGAPVIAANEGVVSFTDTIGVYGKVVGIDHGLGVSTVYGSLASIRVSKGDRIEIGQEIGTVGTSGLSTQPLLYFELRIQGVPVDAREWWDGRWFQGHIAGKIDEVKRQLGIPVYQPFG